MPPDRRATVIVVPEGRETCQMFPRVALGQVLVIDRGPIGVEPCRQADWSMPYLTGDLPWSGWEAGSFGPKAIHTTIRTGMPLTCCLLADRRSRGLAD